MRFSGPFACPLALLLLACPAPGGGDETSDSESTGTSSSTGDTTGETTEPTTGGTTTGEPETYFDDCGDGPPDADCYKQKRDPGSESIALAKAIARRHMAAHPAAEQTWDWEETVFMFSLTELYRVTGEAEFRDHYAAYVDHHIAHGYSIESSDTCAPAAIAAILAMEGDDPAYRAVVDDALYYLHEVALRGEHGGLNHLGKLDLFDVTLWVDSLFMFGNVMTRWGEYADDAALLAEYGEQLRIFTEILQAEGGLYVHSDNWFGVDPDIYWGRGNGWVSAAGFDYLRARTVRGETDEVALGAMTRQAAGIVETQDPSGLWWIVLNRPGESYLETSTAALFAYGLARGFRYGLVGEEVLPAVERALAGVRTKVVDDEDGAPVVTGISGPTMPGNLEHYAKIPVEDDKGYGVGAVILALVESSGLPPSR